MRRNLVKSNQEFFRYYPMNQWRANLDLWEKYASKVIYLNDKKNYISSSSMNGLKIIFQRHNMAAFGNAEEFLPECWTDV